MASSSIIVSTVFSAAAVHLFSLWHGDAPRNIFISLKTIIDLAPSVWRKQVKTIPEPTPQALINPWISALAALLQSGMVTAEDLVRRDTAFGPRVPPALLSFVRALDLSILAAVLRSNARLYRHPLVWRQIDYLLRLRHDEAEWQRLGWVPQYDEEAGWQGPPAEVTAVNQWLERLVEAHVGALFPDQQVRWVRRPQKRGPKSGFRNPHPAGEWAKWVDVESLADDFRDLRCAFRTRLEGTKQAVPRLKAEARAWYRHLAHEVVAQLRRELIGFLQWSAVMTDQGTRYPRTSPPAADRCHPGPSAPAQPRDRELWLDTSAETYVLRRYDTASAAWTAVMTYKTHYSREILAAVRQMNSPAPNAEDSERRKRLELDAALDRMLPPGHTGHHARDGQPAYLAYAVLAALLQ
jgi:hypothetical protein